MEHRHLRLGSSEYGWLVPGNRSPSQIAYALKCDVEGRSILMPGEVG
jgi:hypothetical protein